MTRYLDLAEYLWLAEQVTGTEAAVVAKSSRIDLANSALHAPSASFAGEEFYPDVFDKAAVSCLSTGLEPPAPRWQQASGVDGDGAVHRSHRRDLGPRPSRRG